MTDAGRRPYCRAWIGVYVPKGGDGSLVLLRPHNKKVGIRCPGSKREPLDLSDES
jgi:hypothetical protein